VVLYEFATPADENPDVIGWAPGAGSVLIECKLSRSDFLRDATKRSGGIRVPEWANAAIICVHPI
jgi:hypothetical protein